MPLCWLRCYILMLPRLQAQESLVAVAQIEAGDAWLDADRRRALIDQWQEQLEPEPAPVEPISADEFRARMAMLGLREG